MVKFTFCKRDASGKLEDAYTVFAPLKDLGVDSVKSQVMFMFSSCDEHDKEDDHTEACDRVTYSVVFAYMLSLPPTPYPHPPYPHPHPPHPLPNYLTLPIRYPYPYPCT